MSVRTESDGSFRLGAEPEPGHLFVRGPDDDYVFQAIGSRMVLEGQPGGGRIYSHAYAALDLKPGMGSQEVNLVLRRGATVEGRVVGPDGQPVRDAWIFSRLILDPSRRGSERAGPAAITASCATVGSRSAGSTPMPRSPSISSSRSASWAPSSTSRSSRRRAGRSPSGSSPAGPPGRGSSIPTASRSRNRCATLSITMVVTPGPARNNFPNDKATSLLSADEGEPDRRRPDQLRDGAGPRCRRPDHAPRPDPGRDVSLHRLHHVRPRPDRPGDPQGIHRQAGPEARPGRYPNRQAFEIKDFQTPMRRETHPCSAHSALDRHAPARSCRRRRSRRNALAIPFGD